VRIRNGNDKASPCQCIPREVSTTIELHAPTEDQARAILAEDETAKPYSGYLSGQKAESRLDWQCIRYPAFLPGLVERAKNSNERALNGIASIRTLEATRALADLLRQQDLAFASKAAALIEARLPHSLNEFQGSWGEQKRQFIIEGAWVQVKRRRNSQKFLDTRFLIFV
jgi:hypothetical protein